MPYIESNQDASQSDLFSKALLIGAVAIGGAAAGQMAFKGMAEKLAGKKSAKNGSEILKGLYGKEANKLQKGIAENVSLPNWAEEGPQYALKSRGARAPKLKRTNGTAWENFKSNTLSPSWMADSKSKFFKPADKDLAMFNKHLKDIHKGKMPEYSKSKLDMYEGIVQSADENNINITGRDSVRATNDIYGSNKNYLNRKQAGINNIADDIAITNDIWGGGAKEVAPQSQRTAEIEAEAARRTQAERQAQSEYDRINNNYYGLNNNSPHYKRSGFDSEKDYSNWWDRTANDMAGQKHIDSDLQGRLETFKADKRANEHVNQQQTQQAAEKARADAAKAEAEQRAIRDAELRAKQEAERRAREEQARAIENATQIQNTRNQILGTGDPSSIYTGEPVQLGNPSDIYLGNGPSNSKFKPQEPIPSFVDNTDNFGSHYSESSLPILNGGNPQTKTIPILNGGNPEGPGVPLFTKPQPTKTQSGIFL